MGFRLNRTYALRWDDDHPLAGLEIDMRSTSVGTLAEVRSLRTGEPEDEKRLTSILIDHVLRWNFEDEDGEPLPIAASSLEQQEPVVLSAIAREWYLATAGVTAPLVPRSIDSPPSVEASIPMAES